MSASGSGKLVVISGPSGAGKTSVCRELKKDGRVEFSISATTRPKRETEVDGVDYHFMTPEAFEQAIADDAFLEHAPDPNKDNVAGRVSIRVVHPAKVVDVAQQDCCRLLGTPHVFQDDAHAQENAGYPGQSLPSGRWHVAQRRQALCQQLSSQIRVSQL